MRPRLVLAATFALLLAADVRGQIQGYYGLSLPPVEPLDMVAGDFDGDGLPDVVTVDGQGDVWIVRNLGLGRPAAPVRVGTGVAATSWLAAEDLDGDLDLDLVMGGVRASAPPVAIPNPPFPLPPLPPAPFDRILVGTNDGAGGFAWTYAQLPFYGNGQDAGLGRADADALPDLFLLTATGITVLLNDGMGGFTHLGDFPKTDPALFPPVGPGAIVADVTPGLAVADFDGDGFDDVAVVNNRIRIVDFTQVPFLQQIPVDLVTVHVNDGAGDLSIGAQIPTGSNVTRIVAGELDGTGAADFAVLRPGDAFQVPAPDPGGLAVHLGTGMLSFAATSYPAGFNPKEVVLADFDGDTDLDLLTIAANQYLVGLPPPGFLVEATLHANGGMGGFGIAFVSVCSAKRLPVPADFDGDGILDLAAVCWMTDYGELRFMNSQPRGFALEPGTGDGLNLSSSVAGGPLTGTPPHDVKTLGPGDPFTAVVDTAIPAYIGAPLHAFIGFGVFEWAANPTPGSLQLLVFPIWEIVALPPIPSTGEMVFNGNAPLLFGFNFYVQLGVLSPAAANGVFAVTDAHMFRVR